MYSSGHMGASLCLGASQGPTGVEHSQAGDLEDHGVEAVAPASGKSWGTLGLGGGILRLLPVIPVCPLTRQVDKR